MILVTSASVKHESNFYQLPCSPTEIKYGKFVYAPTHNIIYIANEMVTFCKDLWLALKE